jgi:hypothetical protein
MSDDFSDTYEGQGTGQWDPAGQDQNVKWSAEPDGRIHITRVGPVSEPDITEVMSLDRLTDEQAANLREHAKNLLAVVGAMDDIPPMEVGFDAET